MRLFAVLLSLGATASLAQSHFVFVYVPEKSDTEVRVVFGHGAAPDPNSFPTRAEKTTLTARGTDGKDSKLTLEKGDGNYFRAKLVAAKPVVVFGVTEAGVTQRGDNPPLLSRYYLKTIFGDPFAAGATIGDRIPMEIEPVRDGEKVRFRVRYGGKPLADSEVTVGLPGGDEDMDEVVKTDKEGLTASFAARGRYCVAARKLEDKPGEFGGKKYSAVRLTATLVFDFPAAK